MTTKLRDSCRRISSTSREPVTEDEQRVDIDAPFPGSSIDRRLVDALTES